MSKAIYNHEELGS